MYALHCIKYCTVNCKAQFANLYRNFLIRKYGYLGLERIRTRESGPKLNYVVSHKYVHHEIQSKTVKKEKQLKLQKNA